jgi:hypothetical protein
MAPLSLQAVIERVSVYYSTCCPLTSKQLGTKYEDIAAILRANGHDFENIPGLIEVADPLLPVPPEKFVSGRGRKNFAAAAERDAAHPWQEIKNTTIVFQGIHHPNPYVNRLHHKPWSADFAKSFREESKYLMSPPSVQGTSSAFLTGTDAYFAVMRRGGWNPEDVYAYEQALMDSAPDYLVTWLQREKSSTLSPEVQLMLWSRSPDLWTLTSDKNHKTTSLTWTGFFFPQDWSLATPFNCFWLRFADYSPLFPLRQIGMEEFFGCFITVSYNCPTAICPIHTDLIRRS